MIRSTSGPAVPAEARPGSSSHTHLALTPLALTMGDPAGIGLDISLAAWLARDAHALAPFAFFGDPEALGARAAALGLDVPVAVVGDPREAQEAFATRFPVCAIACAAPVAAGTPDARNARAVVDAIDSAVLAVRDGRARAVVTNPISKAVLMTDGFSHPGHTEYLGALAAAHFGMAAPNPVMLLASEELRVVPLTVHIPLARVAGAISTEAIIATAKILHASLQSDFGFVRPRIAVTGLNPHAGEDGRLGSEDQALIAPAIAALVRDGLDVTGPYPADTLFHAAARATYDAVLAMYHDQALIPIKTLAFDRGVNVTIGLPFVRSSPDHGTAFSLAGTGGAQATSLIEALKMADAIARKRFGAGAS
ncbi:MAG: 4-hydroxythreonine-4-phosphate dehydrogenase PdxA [Hyphomicrobium sp.]|jgi:4-hydroxythreonine-4-phosphate dehydrogenase|uniref:4-hydroxythreonine-4-phosphate dehydrogenase PdxA n=1 Tax=Hyphomicrobium sp. TaxID=82 RepID=UPI0025C34AC0|nr:4-hydroxythreonine-4-phosphate dehydrogenase PdxA [Hyphomicrobium sp.]MBX9861291.1 4-hydroxythreonine-4-phosphate dehydrogenase PdxA [Hyphomicrobium sp.]